MTGIRKKWMAFFLRFDWRLKLGIANAIHLPAGEKMRSKSTFLSLLFQYILKKLIHLSVGDLWWIFTSPPRVNS